MQRSDILTFSYYNTGAPYTGSNKGTRFRIESKKDANDTTVFLVSTWTKDLSHEYVDDEEKVFKEFEFSPDGLDKIFDYLNV